MTRIEGLGLILFDSGLMPLTNQAGGYACLHPDTVGRFVRLEVGAACIAAILEGYFCGPKWNGWCSGYEERPFDEESALFIDAILYAIFHEGHFLNKFIVDRSLMSCSMEAWVHLISDDKEKVSAILVWENSD